MGDVPGQLSLSPSAAVSQVSPWNSAGLAGSAKGRCPPPPTHPQPPALEDLAFMTCAGSARGVLLLAANKENCFFLRTVFIYTERTSLSYLHPTPPPPKKGEGNAFWNLILVGSLKRSFMFIF